MKIRSLSLRGVDPVLLVLTSGLVLFGLVMVYSSSFIFAQERTGDGFAFIKKQLIFAVLGAWPWRLLRRFHPKIGKNGRIPCSVLLSWHCFWC